MLAILYQDDALLVVDKPAGLPVHGGSGIDPRATVLAQLREAGLAGWQPAHRLDAATSGVLLLGRRETLAGLHARFRNQRITKSYLALVQGQPSPSHGRFTGRLLRREPSAPDGGRRKVAVADGGAPATTDYHTDRTWPQATLLALTPHTGRTHQLRVHTASAGHPIAGDRRYGSLPFNRLMRRRYGLDRLFLHAHSLHLHHPQSDRELIFTAPLPAELDAVLTALGPPQRRHP